MLAPISGAFAQEAQLDQEQSAQSGEGGGIADIVVTAQRRSESVQSVPITMTAIGSSVLESAGADQTLALSTVTPGLQLPQNRNSVAPYLRGIGSQNVSPGDEGATAMYVDGVLYAVSGANIFSLNNIERIEVLRGPQGTLFGRNAVGGLINVITRTPGADTEVEGSVSYESYDKLTGSLYAATPLADGISADIAVYGSRQGDGWGRNLNLGNEVNLNEEYAVRSKLVAEAGARTTFTIAADYAWASTDIGNTRQPLPGTRAGGGVGFSGTVFDTTSNLPRYGRKEQYGVMAKIEHDLGWAQLTSTTAYRHYDLNFLFDQDGTSARFLDLETPELTKNFQQELLLSGDAGKLKWTAGAFYFFSDAAWRGYRAASVTPASNFLMYSNMKTNSYAAFAQGTYEITPTTNATLGIRYTYDTRSIEGQRYAAAGNAQPEGTLLLTTDTLPESQTHRNFGKVTWRFALDQRINDNAMLFGSVSRGFKSGVFSVSSPFNPAASPETLDAYEVGLKSDLLDRTLRLNLSAFYYDYKNIQLQANFTGTTSLINAAAGKSKGLEAEVIVAPRLTTGNLELRSSISFLDANYRSFPGGLILTPRATGGNAQTFGDLSGSTFINAPRFTSSVSLNYDAPIFGDYKAGFGVTWYHNGGFYWDVQNRVREPSYDLVSGNIFIALPDDRARLRLYARNLFDKRYYAYVSVSTAGDLGLPAAPRTIGVALDFKF